MRKSRQRISARMAAMGIVTTLVIAGGCGDAEEPVEGFDREAAFDTAVQSTELDPTIEVPSQSAVSGEPDDGSGASDRSAATAPVDEGEPPYTPVSADVLPEPPTGATVRVDYVPGAPPLGAEHAAALREARALREAGRRADAARALRAAEERLGEDAQLRLEAAWCFFEMAEEAFRAGSDPFLVKGSLADAHMRIDQANALHADLPGATVLLAKVLRYEENPDAARALLIAHVERFSGDVGAHRELGDMAQVARDWALADTHFTKAATLDVADGRSRLNATIAKQWLTAEGGASYSTEELHAGYRMAARLMPDDDDPLRLIVGLYPNAPDKRLGALADVLEDNPNGVWARVWKAYLLRGSDPDAALDVLAEAQRIAPDNTAVIVNRAETLAEQGRWNDAVETYIEALKRGEPGTLTAASDALDSLVHLGAQSRDVPLELRDRAYDALCASNPQIGRYGNNAGLWYRDVGQDYEKSLKYYEKAVEAQPDDQDYINDTALIYLFHLRDRKETSLPMFEKVRRLVEVEGQEPIRGYWDTLENLCKYYFETGRFEQVLECAELRADDRAEVNGKPYPSMRAAAYANQARAKLRHEK